MATGSEQKANKMVVLALVVLGARTSVKKIVKLVVGEVKGSPYIVSLQQSLGRVVSCFLFELLHLESLIGSQ